MRLVEESYGSLLKMTLGLERALAKVPRLGTNVGVLMPNLAATLAVVLALSKSARVPAMLNYTAGRDGLSAACVAAQITVVITLRAFVDKAKLAEALDGLPGVELVYLEDLRLNRAGWYCTGDIVDIDEDDFVYVRGRMKRFAKIAREMVSLEAVERILVQGHPDAAHAVVSRPSVRKGEELVLFTTANVVREELRALVKREGLPELAVPAIVRRLDALPTLGSGKTDYVTLNALAREPEADAQPA